LFVIGIAGIIKGIAAKVNHLNRYMQASISKQSYHFIPNTGVQVVNPNSIRFSQSSVNDAQPIINSMQKNGWVGDAIDVVRMPDGGLTSIDNTRLL
jgi:hypothetical protein